MNSLPGDVFFRGIEEDKEAFVVGSVRFVSVEDRVHLAHLPQVDDVNVNLLSDRGRTERVLNVIALGPRTAVHVQVSTKTVHVQVSVYNT